MKKIIVTLLIIVLFVVMVNMTRAEDEYDDDRAPETERVIEKPVEVENSVTSEIKKENTESSLITNQPIVNNSKPVANKIVPVKKSIVVEENNSSTKTFKNALSA